MGEVHVSNHPLILHKLTILRDVTTDYRKFRDVLREVTLLLTYEATHDFTLKPIKVNTPMAANAQGYEACETIGLAPILRAGIGMAEGIMELLPTVQVWHLGMYRDKQTLEPVHYYHKLPLELTVENCILLDPILATGGSAIHGVNLLKEAGVKQIRYLGLIGCNEGIAALHAVHPDVPVYLAAVDDLLTEKGYVLPGLGDSGDRQFGT